RPGSSCDFSLGVRATDLQPSAPFPGADTPGTTVTLNAGSYSVSESSLAGYTSDGGSVDCSGSIAVGDSKTCTFTNTDVAPKLTEITRAASNETRLAGAGR